MNTYTPVSNIAQRCRVLGVPDYRRLPPISIGADPEVFVVNESGEAIFPDRYTRGTKRKPEPLTTTSQIQRDGGALEFNVTPTSLWSSQFLPQIYRAMNAINHRIQLEGGPGVALSTASHAVISGLPESEFAAGCSPDFLSLTGEQNDASFPSYFNSVDPVSRVPRDPYLRYAGGHIHIGWTSNADVTCEEHLAVCRTLITTLGSVYLYKNQENFNTSRFHSPYGSPYLFRPTHYGVEWRGPSNYWIFDPTEGVKLFHMIRSVVRSLLFGGPELVYREYDVGDFLPRLSSGMSDRYPDLPLDFEEASDLVSQPTHRWVAHLHIARHINLCHGERVAV